MSKLKNIPQKTKRIQTDVLIIGAGGAGLRAAIEAVNRGASVLIITKEEMGGAHTSMAMGGMNAAVKAPATPKQHYEDTVAGGWNINNLKLVKIFSKEIPDRIYDLEGYGVKFDRLPDGSFYTWAGGKHSAPLNVCAGDYTGREMINGLVQEVKKLNIAYLEDYFVTKLFLQMGRAIGVFAIDLKSNKRVAIEAKATIIATGGGGFLYLINTNAPSNTGEGYAWALDAGARLVDIEMIQFHPTGIAYPVSKKGRLVTEKVRGHGGRLINAKGERFMTRYQPKRMELAGRDEVARAIYQEVQEGRGTKAGGVYLDVTHWKKGLHEKLVPDVFAEHMEVGIDIRVEPMQISPSMHHMMGGIDINEWGETGVKGLYAVGEVSRNIHGANRLGGNSLSEGQVFGRRVGIQAAKEARRANRQSMNQKIIDQEMARLEGFSKRKKGSSVVVLVKKLQKLMWENVGLIRSEKLLEQAEVKIRKLKKEAEKVVAKNRRQLQQCLELQDMVKTAEAIIVAARLRRESRGAHYRSDYPKRDPNWAKNIVVYKDKNGSLRTRTVSVVK